MNWKAVELKEDHWIIIDEDSQEEYQDGTGHNMMFINKWGAERRIQQIKKEENESSR